MKVATILALITIIGFHQCKYTLRRYFRYGIRFYYKHCIFLRCLVGSLIGA